MSDEGNEVAGAGREQYAAIRDGGKLLGYAYAVEIGRDGRTFRAHSAAPLAEIAERLGNSGYDHPWLVFEGVADPAEGEGGATRAAAVRFEAVAAVRYWSPEDDEPEADEEAAAEAAEAVRAILDAGPPPRPPKGPGGLRIL